MDEREFFIELDEDIKIFVWFSSQRGKIKNFVVKLIFKNIEILRYDSAHGCPHKDILHPDPRKRRKVWYPGLDKATVLTLAISELKQEYEFLIERYLKWFEEEQKSKKS